MADYINYSRTNYFRVTDPKRFEEIVDLLDDAEIITRNENNSVYYGFMGSFLTSYYDEEKDETVDIDSLLQEVLHPEDEIVIKEIGYEKMRYLHASALIIGKESTDYIDLDSKILEAFTGKNNPYCEY